MKMHAVKYIAQLTKFDIIAITQDIFEPLCASRCMMAVFDPRSIQQFPNVVKQPSDCTFGCNFTQNTAPL